MTEIFLLSGHSLSYSVKRWQINCQAHYFTCLVSVQRAVKVSKLHSQQRALDGLHKVFHLLKLSVNFKQSACWILGLGLYFSSSIFSFFTQLLMVWTSATSWMTSREDVWKYVPLFLYPSPLLFIFVVQWWCDHVIFGHTDTFSGDSDALQQCRGLRWGTVFLW